MSILLIIGGITLIVLLYWFSVKTIIAVYSWQEMSGEYEVTDHPEHDKLIEERFVAQSHERAVERLIKGRLTGIYCIPFFECALLIDSFTQGDE